MNFPCEFQEEVEQWATSAGLSAEQFVMQVMSERLTVLRQQQNSDTIASNSAEPVSSDRSRLHRKQGVLVIQTDPLSGFDINAFVNEMREERIQDQIGQVSL
jgi:hypothetical protein